MSVHAGAGAGADAESGLVRERVCVSVVLEYALLLEAVLGWRGALGGSLDHSLPGTMTAK